MDLIFHAHSKNWCWTPQRDWTSFLSTRSRELPAPEVPPAATSDSRCPERDSARPPRRPIHPPGVPRLTGGITLSVAPPPLSLAFNQGPRSVSSTSLMSLQPVPLWNSPLSNSKEPPPPPQVWTINDASADSQPPVAAPPRLHSQGPSFCGLRAVSMQFPLLRRQKTLTQPRAEREPGEWEMRQFGEPSILCNRFLLCSFLSFKASRPAHRLPET